MTVFGLVPCEPAAIVEDTCSLIRKNTRLIFEKVAADQKTTRQVARELFVPDTFDTPDI